MAPARAEETAPRTEEPAAAGTGAIPPTADDTALAAADEAARGDATDVTAEAKSPTIEDKAAAGVAVAARGDAMAEARLPIADDKAAAGVASTGKRISEARLPTAEVKSSPGIAPEDGSPLALLKLVAGVSKSLAPFRIVGRMSSPVGSVAMLDGLWKCQ